MADDGLWLIFNDDIITEILLWLPVISLLRFRCVCKSWRALISSSNFIAKHLRRAATKNVLLFNVPSPRFPQLVDYQSLMMNKNSLNDSHRHNAFDGYEFPDTLNDLSSLGSCNGLICLKGKYIGYRGIGGLCCSHRERFYFENSRILLWNPSTRKIRKLPDIDSFRFGPLFYGFGYDSTTQDYKVVLGGHNSIDCPGIVAIFALKTGSWKIVRDLGNQDIILKTGCFLNGALHWVVDVETGYSIKSFDLAQEKFQLLSFINFHRRIGYGGEGLGTIGNRLCFFAFKDTRNPNLDDAVKLWVMMEYGVDQSWTILVKIRSDIMPPNVPWLMPISYLEDGHVLMTSSEGDLVLYVP